jgi:hypothetical protein
MTATFEVSAVRNYWSVFLFTFAWFNDQCELQRSKCQRCGGNVVTNGPVTMEVSCIHCDLLFVKGQS